MDVTGVPFVTRLRCGYSGTLGVGLLGLGIIDRLVLGREASPQITHKSFIDLSVAFAVPSEISYRTAEDLRLAYTTVV